MRNKTTQPDSLCITKKHRAAVFQEISFIQYLYTEAFPLFKPIIPFLSLAIFENFLVVYGQFHKIFLLFPLFILFFPLLVLVSIAMILCDVENLHQNDEFNAFHFSSFFFLFVVLTVKRLVELWSVKWKCSLLYC